MTETLTHRQKAVAVAKDILATLDSHTYRAGAYFCSIDGPTTWGYVPDHATDLREAAAEIAANCSVCFLGGCLLAKARLYDAVPVATLHQLAPYPHADAIFDPLADVFSPEQIVLLEAAFEQRPVPYTHFSIKTRVGLKERELAAKFCAGADGRNRARRIAENIIVNDGEFVP